MGESLVSDALDVVQVATGGAAVFVAEMAKSGWDAFRRAVVHFFRLGGEENAEEELRLVDAARVRLLESPDGERDTVMQALQQQLLIQLAAFLQKHPDGAVELQALVDRSEESGSKVGAQVNVHHNTGSQVLLAGHDVNAGDFTYRAPENEK